MPISVPALLDSAQTFATAADSSDAALDLLQIVDASHAYTSGYTRRNYYDSAGLLPTADSSMEGMISLVKGADPYTGSGNGLYLCTGTEWTQFYDLDSGTNPYAFQGEDKAYVYGGAGNPPQSPATASNDLIDAFPFASDTNATDTANLIAVNQKLSGVSSASAGYDWTGTGPGGVNGRHATFGIDKFVFASETDATPVSNSIGEYGVHHAASASDISAGYTFGGQRYTYPGSGVTFSPSIIRPLDTVLKLTYASDTSGAADHGNLNFSQGSMAGLSSPTEGKAYTAAGTPGAPTNTPFVGTVREIPFASGTSVTTRSNGVSAYGGRTGVSSPTDGYVAGGRLPSGPPYAVTDIDKFPFASDTAKSDQGDLVSIGYGQVGNSSSSNGYISGGTMAGTPAPPTAGVYNDTIQKFPFASATNATDIGNLSRGAYNAGGWQN